MVKSIRVKSLDFVFSINRLLGGHEFRKEIKKIGVTPSEEIEALIDELSSNVSMRVSEDLKLLFKKYYLDSLIYNLAVKHPDLPPRELIALIEEIGAEHFYETYINEFVRPVESTEAAIKERIESLIENNTTQIVMSYTQLKKFKHEAPEIFKLCVNTLKSYVETYELIEDRVKEIYNREIVLLEADMIDENRFRNSYLMIQLEGETDAIKEITVCMTVLGEYVLMYSIHKSHQSLNMIVGFGMKKVISDKEKTIEQEVFKSLGDPTKLLMIQMASKEPVCAKDYADRLKLSKATISHHVSILLGLRLLSLSLQEGKKMYYVTNIEMIKRLFDNFINDLEQ